MSQWQLCHGILCFSIASFSVRVFFAGSCFDLSLTARGNSKHMVNTLESLKYYKTVYNLVFGGKQNMS